MKVKISKSLRCSNGSGVVEFVLLALPLFVPLFIFLSHFETRSFMETSMRSLAREMIRGFVLSESDSTALRVSNKIFLEGGAILGLQREIKKEEITFTIECKNQPCISPSNKIVITLRARTPKLRISVTEFVSPWV